MSLEKSGSAWEILVTFDAAYALPEYRNDKATPQPKRQWLFDKTPKEHERLRNEAASYIRESIRFTHGGQAVAYDLSFPDYNSLPPDFPKILNGGAYFRVLISGQLPNSQDSNFKLESHESTQPNLIVAIDDTTERNYLVIPPGKSETLFSTTSSGTFVPANPSPWTLTHLGYTHVIPQGLDHLLFILALFLMAREWRPLLSQSLMFTLAHSLTLGLATSGIFQIRQWPLAWLIEPCIALSIAIIAIENIFTKKVAPHRLLIVFLLGLIHGLGFSNSFGSALNNDNHWFTSLALANIGVELAQITILALAWALTIRWWRSSYYAPFRLYASATIATIGIWWSIQRLFFS